MRHTIGNTRGHYSRITRYTDWTIGLVKLRVYVPLVEFKVCIPMGNTLDLLSA